MDEKYNPVQIINARIVDRLDRFIKKEIKIWKVDKWGRKTLNLSNVRKLHGRNLLKKMYKERDQLQDTMTISKSRNNKKIIQKNQDNEKVLTLF